jgi:hypothetical protein
MMKNNYLRFLLILISLVIYLSFLSPSIVTGDSGEFIASAYTLGIPHPPGYPFYMILGRLFSILFPGNPALGMNLLSLLFAIFSVLLLFQLLVDKGTPSYIAFIPSLLLSIHPLFLRYATISEVYTLTSFFFLLELLLLKRKKYRLLSYITGLSFLIHPILWLIGLYMIYRILREDYRFLIYALIGFSVTLYIPLRSNFNPLIDWGNPEGLKGLISHLLRFEYYREVTVPFSFSIIFRELLIWLRILLRDANFLLLLLPFAFLSKKREYLLLLLIYSIPLTLFLHFKPTLLDLEANRVFFIPQLILILILSTAGLKRLKKKFLPIATAFLLTVFCMQCYQERLFTRSWTAFDYLLTVLKQTEVVVGDRHAYPLHRDTGGENEGVYIPVIESRGDALTFPLLYGEVVSGKVNVKVNTPGLKLHLGKEANYSTYADDKFKFYDRLLFTKDKREAKPWNFKIRQGRKDILEDELYIKALTHYAIYLHAKGDIPSSLLFMKRAKELAWLNQHKVIVSSAYCEVKHYRESVKILMDIYKKHPDYPGIYHRLYYTLWESGEEGEALEFLSMGLLTQEDENLLNDAGAYFAERGFKSTAFLLFFEGITKGAQNAGANLNNLIQREILR